MNLLTAKGTHINNARLSPIYNLLNSPNIYDPNQTKRPRWHLFRIATPQTAQSYIDLDRSIYSVKRKELFVNETSSKMAEVAADPTANNQNVTAQSGSQSVEINQNGQVKIPHTYGHFTTNSPLSLERKSNQLLWHGGQKNMKFKSNSLTIRSWF